MSGEKTYYKRFSLAQRVEHIVMFTAFIVLAVTGLPQKFAEAGISQALINLFGGIESTRQIHHIAAIVLLIGAAFHIVAVGYRLFVMRSRPSLLPGLKDVRDGLNDFLYNFGARKSLSQSGRFTWMEKVEYWALVWGVLVMALTGFFLWNPIATTQILPGEAIPAAKTAHGWEAVLAVAAVIIWHFYSVHLKRFNKSMFTGKMSEHEMQEEHPLELADIKAGVVPRPRDPKYSRRQAIYVPLASVIGAVLVVGIIRFMTFEKTAIETIPQRFDEHVQVFAPLAPTPFPTPRPTSTPQPTPESVVADWAAVSAALEKECAGCHNGTVAGMDFTTYAGVMKGGAHGPVIVPGDPANSLIVQKVSGGAHPGKLAPAELAALEAWIAAGASETGAGVAVTGSTTPAGGTATPPATSGGAAATQWSDFEAIFAAKCAACHINAAMGDLSLKTYADALKGGKDGAAIVPNDPGKSVLVQVQQKGGHPGMLSADELNALIAWINAGAPETAGSAGPSSGENQSGGGDVWTGGIDQLINAKCAACHINAAMGDLSLKTYADALKGGKDGPAIVPNDPAKSMLVQIQQKGGHPGQLTPEEIDRVVKWIEAGAPETASTSSSAPAATPPPTATPVPVAPVKTWSDAVAIFTAKCTVCHINAQAGNLSLKTYQDALKGGQSGPAIVPSDPDKSVLVKTQQGTSHPAMGMLTPGELAAIIAWIEAGAPEK